MVRRYENGQIVGVYEAPANTFIEWLDSEIAHAKKVLTEVGTGTPAYYGQGRLRALEETKRAYDARNPVEEL